MVSVFAQLEERASAAVDHVYAERVRIDRKLMRKSAFEAAADDNRTSITVLGVVDINPKTIELADKSEYDGMGAQIRGESVHVSFDLSRFETDDDRPAQGDRLIAEDRSPAPAYRVTRVDPDGLGRIVCVCALDGTD
jgi:hypothetical protein